MSTIKVRLDQAHPVLSRSIQCAIKSHGLTLCDQHGRQLDAAQYERLLEDMGRDAAQSLATIILDEAQ